MKKRVISLILTCALLVGMLPVWALAAYQRAQPEIWDGTVAESYAGGSGTQKDPYLIANGAQLAKFAQAVNNGTFGMRYAALTNDIYLNDTSDWQSWDEDTAPKNHWTPIGNVTNTFYGQLDGRGYAIRGVYINLPEQEKVGLFGVIRKLDSWTNVLNLSLEESLIIGKENVGGIAGFARWSNMGRSSTISNCHNDATVQGVNRVGGILGGVEDTLYVDITIDKSSNSGTINGDYETGGIAGYCDVFRIKNCYNVGTITGEHDIGGIVGLAHNSVSDCWNLGNVFGRTKNVGGVAGAMTNRLSPTTSVTIERCFNAGAVSGEYDVGGITGYMTAQTGYKSNVNNCYNTGTVTATKKAAGIVATTANTVRLNGVYNAGTVQGEPVAMLSASARLNYSCYLDETGTATDAQARTARELKKQKTVYELNGDSDVWVRDTGYYNSGYPLISTIDYSVYAQYVPMTTPDPPIGTAEFSQAEYEVDIYNEVTMFVQIDTEVELTQADIEWYSSNETVAPLVPEQQSFLELTEEEQAALGYRYLAGIKIACENAGSSVVSCAIDNIGDRCRLVVGQETPDFDLSLFRATVQFAEKADGSFQDQTTYSDLIYNDTPGETVLQLLEEGGFIDYAKWWTALENCWAMYDDISQVHQLANVKEKDIYAGVLIAMLQTADERIFSKMISTAQKIFDEDRKSELVKETVSFFNDVLEKNVDTQAGWDSLTEKEVGRLKVLTYEKLGKFYHTVNFFDTVFNSVDKVLERAKSLDGYVDDLFNALALAEACDERINIMERMLAASPEGSQLRAAIEECLELMKGSTENALVNFMEKSCATAGIQAAGYLLNEFIWKNIKLAMSPELETIHAAYKGMVFVVNLLTDNDKKIEQMSKLAATVIVESLLNQAYSDTKNEFLTGIQADEEENIKLAKNYLAAVDLGYSALLQDCDEAIRYYEICKDAPFVGDEPFDKLIEQVNGQKDGYDARFEESQTGWIEFLKDNEKYQALYEQYKRLEEWQARKYTVACPVDVYVYQSGNQEPVAWVKDNQPGCAEGSMISVIVEGDQKTFLFYDDTQYDFRYVGNGDGDMDVTIQEFDQVGALARTVAYTALPLSVGQVYTSQETKGAGAAISYTMTQEQTGSDTDRPITPAVDTQTDPKYQADIVQGSFWIGNTVAVSAEVCANETLEIYAHVPTGYEFVRWESETGKAEFADASASETSVRMPAADETITAVLRELPAPPDEQPQPPAGGTGGGSTGGGTAGYTVSLPSDVKNGSVSVSPKNAAENATVTITVKPDAGYVLDTLTVTAGDGSKLAVTKVNDTQYTFRMPASQVSIEAAFRQTSAEPVNPFTDVSANQYYYDAVLWALANGITNGTSPTTFEPDAGVSRAQMVTFLWRASGSPQAAGTNPFTDVERGDYYYDAVLWAAANGITNGTSAAAFSPGEPVSRAQAVTFQWRAAGSPAVSGGSFTDVAADAYYASAVAWAVENGVTNGTAATTFEPDAKVSRAQAVAFLYRAAS
ncbi:hypothetical protein AGATL06_23700 [Agathobaculum sp. TL06]